MNKTVEDVLFEVVDICESLRLELAIMGGIAVRIHGIPRPTFDVDIELTVNQTQLDSFFINETPFQQSIMQRRQHFEMSGRSLPFVTPEDLILLKLLANRPRDIGDVADVLFVQGQLDETYLRHWAEILNISDRLAQAISH